MKIADAKRLRSYLTQTPHEKRATIFFIISRDPVEREELMAWVVDQKARRTIDASTVSAATLVSELETESLFGENALVCKRAESLTPSCREVIKKYCSNPNPHRLLCLEADSSDTGFIQLIGHKAVVVDLVAIPPWERQQQTREWLERYAQTQNKVLTAAALDHLCGLGTDERSFLRSELDRIFVLIGDRDRIALEDVQTIVPPLNAMGAWNLGQAVLERRTADALHLLSRLLLKGEPAPHALLAQLRSQMSTAYRMVSLHAEGVGLAELGRQFPQFKGRRLEREMNRARGYGLQHYQKAILFLAHADLNSKGQSVDMSVLLETVVIRLTQ